MLNIILNEIKKSLQTGRKAPDYGFRAISSGRTLLTLPTLPLPPPSRRHYVIPLRHSL